MIVKHLSVIILFLVLTFCSCKQEVKAPNPWGTEEADGSSADDGMMQLNDIIHNGELIMVTISGPETYYEYRGRGMGLHYLLCEKFCHSVGVSLRVDVCKDTLEMIRRVKEGEADVIAMPFSKEVDSLRECAGDASQGQWHWLVNEGNASLADALDGWLTAARVKQTDEEQSYWLSSASVTRHVYAPMQNRAKGIISDYDYLFQRYAPVARWDWRLLAAQCYQESTFDARARSWAGACGLMQIMPSTADHLKLARSDIFNPEKNVAAATQYIAELTRAFSDIPNTSERMKFVLASYNGGAHHIRDAMSLARKYGKNAHSWSDVRSFVLRLSKAEYYNDEVVKYGYMRGSETVDYVDRIWDRWLYYRGVKSRLMKAPSPSHSPSVVDPTPHPSARRKAKYDL